MSDIASHDASKANFTLKNRKYLCPVHGVVEQDITSNIPGHEGIWCQICWLESFDRIGIQRMTIVE
jgi:hypothetical protein